MRHRRHSRFRILKGLGLAIAILAAGGCASPYRRVDQLVTSPYQSILLVSNIPQSKLKRQINLSAPGMAIGPDAATFNLLSAAVTGVIDIIRAHHAQNSINDLRTFLQNEDVGRKINGAYARRLRRLRIGRIAGPVDRVKDDHFQVSDLMAKSNADCILYIRTRYRMTPSMEAFEMVADYAIYDRTNGNRPVYHNQVIYQSPVDPSAVDAMTPQKMAAARTRVKKNYMHAVRRAHGSRDEIKRARKLRDLKLRNLNLTMVANKAADFRWSDHQGRRLKAYIDAGTATLARLVRDDLNGVQASGKAVDVPARARNGAGTKMVKMYPLPHAPKMSAFVARLRDGTLIAKSSDGPFLLP